MKAQICSFTLSAAACVASMFYAHAATAQIDLTGRWGGSNNQDYNIRAPGPNYADYTGIPLNDQARQRALLSYTPDSINELNRECQPWPLTYLLVGPGGLNITSTENADGAVIAWNIAGSLDREPMTIWMPAAHRKAPSPQALNIPGGFSTGQWRGDTLVTTTTHLQDGFLTRNGVPSSDQEVFTMYITRHGNILLITGVIQDPVYLTAPYVLAEMATLAPPNRGGGFGPATCTPEEEVPSVSGAHVESYMTVSQNPNYGTVTRLYHIPREAAMGGAETMYPQFIKKIRNQYTTPSNYCTIYCCGGSARGGGAPGEFDHNVLKCKDDFN